MKNLINTLLGLSVISIVLAIISKLSQQAVLGLGPRAMVGFAAILLLLAIALSVRK